MIKVEIKCLAKKNAYTLASDINSIHGPLRLTIEDGNTWQDGLCDSDTIIYTNYGYGKNIVLIRNSRLRRKIYADDLTISIVEDESALKEESI